MYALDTNCVIHAFKGLGLVKDRLLACPARLLSIPAIVRYELEYGTLRSAHPSRRRADIEVLLRDVRVLPFDDASALRAAAIRRELEARGETIGPMDLLIAGTVLSAGAILVSRNQSEFKRVPGLVTENWYDA